jgi:hypothetical protein
VKSEFSVLMQKLKQLEGLTNSTVRDTVRDTVIRLEEQDSAFQQKSANRTKRQLAFAGGMGLGFGAYDYNDYYGDYASDYAYDYYDWVCSDQSCQLCDILTSECCDPELDVNCFLPDSCLNNPCLSGGTCITSVTLDGRPDFICVCLPGLTGKYCQLVNDYFIGAEIGMAPFLPPPPPPPMPAYAPSYAPSYAPPQPAYAPPPVYAQPPPQASYGQQAPPPQQYGQGFPQQGQGFQQQGQGFPQQGMGFQQDGSTRSLSAKKHQ